MSGIIEFWAVAKQYGDTRVFDDLNLDIRKGATPAELLAVCAELFYEGLERWLIPRHLLSAKISG